MRAVMVLGVLAATSACPNGREPTLTAIRADIFEPRCSFAACHGGANPVRGLDLENDPLGTLVNVDSVADPSLKRVLPGDPDNSVLFLILQGPVGDAEQMPPGVEMPADEVEQVRAWIEAGANDD